ncbi:MAG: hypothetical protein IT372_42165 [Polyangiaceae bacterium]|nr:hypothetical protein [Polyangiaceae bacterium]
MNAPAPDDLLAQIDGELWGLSMDLLWYKADDRVRETLVEAVRRAHRINVFQPARALGFVGGRGAREVLAARLAELVDESPEPVVDAAGEPLLSVAAALLRLDADATDAAMALIHLIHHADVQIRRLATRDAVSVFRRDPQTLSMSLLQEAFGQLLDVDDSRTFLDVAFVLARDHGDVVLKRCRGLLDGDDHELRQWAAVALARTPAPHTAEALAILASWAPRGEPLGLALWVASLVWPLMREIEMAELVRRGLASESATTRSRTIEMAHHLGEASARPLLEQALADEPDPILRENMARALETQRA